MPRLFDQPFGKSPDGQSDPGVDNPNLFDGTAGNPLLSVEPTSLCRTHSSLTCPVEG